MAKRKDALGIDAKERILNKIKQALVNPVPLPFTHTDKKSENIIHPLKQELEIEFAENFTSLQGKFLYCGNVTEAQQSLQQLIASRKWTSIYCAEASLQSILNETVSINNKQSLQTCDVAITSCAALIARTGSFLLDSGTESGRAASVFAPIHICVAYTSQLVYDIKDGLQLLQKKYGKNALPSTITLASGPSRTADIEKTLVVGVHGPKEVFCFLIQD